jgi:hypothetical protein
MLLAAQIFYEVGVGPGRHSVPLNQLNTKTSLSTGKYTSLLSFGI